MNNYDNVIITKHYIISMNLSLSFYQTALGLNYRMLHEYEYAAARGRGSGVRSAGCVWIWIDDCNAN